MFLPIASRKRRSISGSSAATISFRDVVRKMYNRAKKPAKLIPKDYDNPVAGITRFPQYKRRRFLTTVEMPRFIRGLEAEHNDYAGHAIWMLLFTGLRMHEILKAKWEHADWVEGTLSLASRRMARRCWHRNLMQRWQDS